MNNIEKSIKDRILSTSAITDLIVDRCYFVQKQQNALMPCISFFRVSTVRQQAMEVDVQVVRARFQFDIWAETYTSAVVLKNELLSIFNRWTQASNPKVHHTTRLTEIDRFEDEVKQFHIAVDMYFDYDEI